MRFFLKVLVVGFVGLSAVAEGFTVVSYNVWNGFNEKSAVQMGIEWIETQDADVVALQELVGIDASELSKMASEWGHSYSAILKERGYPVGITSRTPIEIIERRMDGMHHGYLHARTADFNFFVVHLAPGDNRLDVRKRELEILTPILTPLIKSEESVVVLGDFNNVSPVDVSDGSRDVSVIQGFLDTGLVDVVHYLATSAGRSPRGTFPTRTFTPEATQEEHEPKTRRIDYVFTNPKLNATVKSAASPRHPDLDVISDHYPVVVRFDK
jgi:exonuclease III